MNGDSNDDFTTLEVAEENDAADPSTAVCSARKRHLKHENDNIDDSVDDEGANLETGAHSRPSQYLKRARAHAQESVEDGNTAGAAAACNFKTTPCVDSGNESGEDDRSEAESSGLVEMLRQENLELKNRLAKEAKEALHLADYVEEKRAPLKTKIAVLKKSLEAMEDAMAQEQDEKEELEEHNAELQWALQKKGKKLKEKSLAIEHLKYENMKQKKELEWLKSQNTGLQSSLDQQKHDKEVLEDTLASTQNSLVSVQTQLKQTSKELLQALKKNSKYVHDAEQAAKHPAGRNSFQSIASRPFRS